jgi:GAF domain
VSDHSDSPNASVTTASRVFVDDTVSRVFVGETLSRVSVSDTTLEETLRGVAELANAAIGGSDMVGVTMLMAGRPRTAVSTDDTVSEVDDVQYRSGMGPCLETCDSRQVRRGDSAEIDDRWPAFSRAASARGIVSSMSVPLAAHHQVIGALNCYSRSAQPSRPTMSASQPRSRWRPPWRWPIGTPATPASVSALRCRLRPPSNRPRPF